MGYSKKCDKSDLLHCFNRPFSFIKKFIVSDIPVFDIQAHSHAVNYNSGYLIGLLISS